MKEHFCIDPKCGWFDIDTTSVPVSCPRCGKSVIQLADSRDFVDYERGDEPKEKEK
jgi:predicted RNA-binding Zn-ribbon protein involved in translation (DUF1610 family)